ncbi:hypothetical protein [Amycolatopsis vastitatis]|uniref:Uncharacterized protein n=1 Tax=Amycolatopsis vastitatis TaxID=1905142 RepID=A0A229SMC8_9PSEU|nr:hypothetical protein [Amycolatopsis vastitatis]OXM59988.1 hypothetical protein CF165_44615 [Amycolatopsis vastitatis]
MTRIVATEPLGVAPTWAVLQRALFDALDEAWRVYEARYCEPDGSLRYTGSMQPRDGADDFYEAFTGWGVLYQLGGSAELLAVTKRHWEAVTEQMDRRGYIADEFELGYDWFHIGEQLTVFLSLCAGDPADESFHARAVRFAELYLPDSPTGNYDQANRMIRAPHNGGGGPRHGVCENWRSYGAELTNMQPYGLPLEDVPGVDSWEDLADPANADAMGKAMWDRLGQGDVAVNLAATSLAANAWLYGHDERFRAWALEYLDAWVARAAANGGIVPDNVGPAGEVGELHGGRWYGGNYGWTWPHGLHTIGMAVGIAVLNAALLSGDPGRLDFARSLLDQVYHLGVDRPVDDSDTPLRDRWAAELGEETATPTFLVPNRYGLGGWFDFQPPQVTFPVWLWQTSLSDADWKRITDLRERGGYDWRTVRDFRNKEDAGHEAPWIAYLQGDNPDYPEQILGVALSQVRRRLALIARDTGEVKDRDIHHWQRHNPVTTEALLQLTTGTPQVLFNGGLLPFRVSYADAETGRPGLPLDVASLVDTVEAGRTCLELVNLAGTGTRRVVVRAGGFGADRIDEVHYSGAETEYPGAPTAYTAPASRPVSRIAAVGASEVAVELPPGTRIRLDLRVTVRANPARHRTTTIEGTS